MDLRPKGGAASPAPAPRSAESRLAAVLAGSRTWVDIEIPRTSPVARGRMRRLTRAEEEQVSTDLGVWLRVAQERGMPPPLRGELDSQEAVRVLAIAVRDPADPAQPLASLEDWGAADDGQVGAIYRRYLDLVDETDLFRDDLTPEQTAEIRDAVKKKDVTRLLAFGARKLTAYLRGLESQPEA